MSKRQSGQRIVHSDIGVKSWLAELPSVDRARPSRCPCCGRAGRPVGEALGLVGHGVRERQVRGPLGPSEPAAWVTLRVRRYRCRSCGAVPTVLPRGLVARRQYAATAIGLALFLLGVVGLAVREVRERVSPLALSFDAEAWATLRRWVRAVELGLLFRPIRASPAGFSLRKRAERAAMTLVAMAPPNNGAAEAAVMAGAERAA